MKSQLCYKVQQVFGLVEIHGDWWHILGDGGDSWPRAQPPGRDDPAGSQTLDAGSRADNRTGLTAAFTPNLPALRWEPAGFAGCRDTWLEGAARSVATGDVESNRDWIFFKSGLWMFDRCVVRTFQENLQSHWWTSCFYPSIRFQYPLPPALRSARPSIFGQICLQWLCIYGTSNDTCASNVVVMNVDKTQPSLLLFFIISS